ncbi:MAG: hypothetical protein COB02_03705 [Candidatus Cloacimonadota bacterium]|nr:MAG: hypothetical protein COB02_03705 [Candidatus Cloacimonadota bacterium]
MYELMCNKGYEPASYLHNSSNIWKNVTLGKHIFILEGVTVQPFSIIEDNVMIWCGSQICHHTIISKNVFIASNVTISGSCNVGEFSFIGANTSFNDEISVGKKCLIGSGSTLIKNIEDNARIVGINRKI